MEFFFLNRVIMGHLLDEDPNNNIIVTVAMDNNRSLALYMADHLYEIMDMMARNGLLYFYIDGNIRQVLSHMKDDEDNRLKRQQLARAIQNLCPNMSSPAVTYYIDSILQNRAKIIEMAEMERVDIPESDRPDDFYRRHFEYLAQKCAIQNRNESAVYPLRITDDGNGNINTILIGNLYEIRLDPQEMALYSLVAYLGRVRVSDLVLYTQQLEKLNKTCRIKQISEQKNREAVRKIVNDNGLGSLVSNIKNKIQQKLSINPEIYEQYIIERQPTAQSDVLRIRLNRDLIDFHPSIREIFNS